MAEQVDTRSSRADWFETHRDRLRAVAYRMLGSAAEAEDAVQETWLRLDRSTGTIDNLGGWLTTVVGRVCIDMLRARSSRREQPAGTWLPESIVPLDSDVAPEQQSVIADSVGLALLVVLERLPPAERLAFVLHDTFGVPFGEIAPIVDRTPEATRQLASRARRRVRGAEALPERDLARRHRVVEAFLAAARDGDFDRLVELLDPDVVFRMRGGPVVFSGGTEIGRRLAEDGSRFAAGCRPALIDGEMGMLVESAGKPFAVARIRISGGRIVEIEMSADPAVVGGGHPGDGASSRT